ncbi:11830_t:CDS:2, partial [Gigaspora margarita]
KRRSYKPTQNQDNFEGIDTMEATMQPDNYHKVGLYDHGSVHQSSQWHNITNDKSDSRTNGTCQQMHLPNLGEVDICKSTIDFTTQSISQDLPRESHSDTDFPIMAFSFWFLTLIDHLKSQVENLRSTCIRRQLKHKGFSDRAAELYISSYDPKASESVSAYIVDILPTMDYIQSLGSNLEMTILNLAQKMALLLALMSGMSIQNPKEAKISRAHRGTKEQNKPLFIGSYPEDEAFCALSAFNTYRARTSEWRTSNKTQKSLFLTTTMPHRLASTNSIVRWIKSCLTKSSEDLTAKDTQVILAFLAQNSGADLATIMALGNWLNEALSTPQ